MLQLQMIDMPAATQTQHAPTVSISPEVADLLADNAPVAVGVSGGKDSCAVAIVVNEYLDSIGHTGPRVLIHSDLGRVEWRDSLPTCERLAALLNWPLVVVKREAGDMMDRWLTRWANNVERYQELRCVKLILPWSTPSMRFCTSELKTAVICRDLVSRFPSQSILSVSGVRRDESAQRAKSEISKPQMKLTSKTHETSGLDWNPLLDWSTADVFAKLAEYNFTLHEAYTTYGSSRVSCAFCIMSSSADLAASVSCLDNHYVYREMCELEATSTFSFQGNWLADVAPELLNESLRSAIADAKQRAVKREEIEARIPEHLLYTKGWPTCLPTKEEAELLCEVRREVSALMGWSVKYTEPDELISRYAELMKENEEKEAKKQKTAAKAATLQMMPYQPPAVIEERQPVRGALPVLTLF